MTPFASPAIQSVLELFRDPLANLRFADVDAQGLAQLAAEVESAAEQVNEHEAQLAQLRQGLAERQEALLVLAQRALAYARVYAENNDALLAELNLISLPRAGKPRKPSAAKAASATATAAPSSPAAATLAVEETTESAPAAAAAPAEASEAPTARATKKVVRGRLSRAFSRENSS